ncbi:hypothetical protein DL766_007472 [Monosporascus sp. MC13-8B]|uniref:Cyclin-dependent kinase n=1 Tax=Monosporascus cannonballus TaxID=155416 RepID=A0ABY0GSZ7_9PEZI|nr:hypothetical protein DL762_009586 [Monosporascus cannonballus]RYO82037.1 hypothetical protein DL763_008369 [Monosporascus cannonballus]RYP23763.1 hypothetical protein DL766_007472 [Monosporascus sp. MC13-8B]
MEASPSKRRVLGAIDANTRSPTTAVSRVLASKHDAIKPRLSVASARVLSEGKKRPLAAEQQEAPGQTAEGHRAAKKPCLPSAEDDQSPRQEADDDVPAEQTPQETEQQRSVSPADSSIFDSSVHDISQSTVMTEPDAEGATGVAGPLPAAPPPPQRPPMTREEARQKAEVLRLRLGLASYKVRTGQTDVPLERLQVRPLTGSRRIIAHGSAGARSFRSTGSASGENTTFSRASHPAQPQPLPRQPPLPMPSLPRDRTGEEEQPEAEKPRRQTSAPPPQRKALPTAPLQRGASFSHAPDASILARGLEMHGSRRRPDGADETIVSSAKGLLNLSRQ